MDDGGDNWADGRGRVGFLFNGFSPMSFFTATPLGWITGYILTVQGATVHNSHAVVQSPFADLLFLIGVGASLLVHIFTLGCGGFLGFLLLWGWIGLEGGAGIGLFVIAICDRSVEKGFPLPGMEDWYILSRPSVKIVAL